MMRALLAIAALCLACTVAQAQRVSRVDGQKLRELCSAKPAECDAYIGGVADTLGALKQGPACIPSNVKGSQLREIVLKYLTDKPQALSKSAADATLGAFAGAFPCKGRM